MGLKKFEDFVVEEGFLDDATPIPGAVGDNFAKKFAKFLCRYAFDEKKAELFAKEFIDVTKSQHEVREFIKQLPYYIRKYKGTTDERVLNLMKK